MSGHGRWRPTCHRSRLGRGPLLYSRADGWASSGVRCKGLSTDGAIRKVPSAGRRDVPIFVVSSCNNLHSQLAMSPVPSVRRAMVSGPTDDAGVELDALAEINSVRSPNGNIPMPTARLVAEVPSGQTNRPERLDDDVRLAGPYRCRRSPETGRRNSGCSPAPILPDLAP
jgi:hypothetical protein